MSTTERTGRRLTPAQTTWLSTVLAVVRPHVRRPDVVGVVGEYALGSGFSAAVIRRPGGGAITVYGLAADGMLHPLAGQRRRTLGGVLTLARGQKVRIGAPIPGRVEGMVSQTETIGIAQIPSGVTIAGYDLLTLHAAGPIGPSDLTISDLPGIVPGHDIYLHALPSSGATLGVRVGSCLQWHGYRSRTLYVAQTGGAPISRLQLSGIGPADSLRAAGVPVVHDLPGVGSNMQDHLDLYAISECTGDHTYDRVARPHRTVWAGLQYLLFKTGPVTSTLFETGGFWYADKQAR